MTDRPFSREALELLRDRREIRIETHAPDGSVHRTIVWVVVDDQDRVLVRSYRGADARWYREAISGRPVTLHLDADVHPVTVERARDPERVASCSRKLEAKYAGDPSTLAMVRDEVLDTTLQLRPA